MDRSSHPGLACLGVVLISAGVACTTSGHFEGDLEEPPAAQDEAAGPPPPRHERVEFTWASEDGGSSGTLNVRLPGGHSFQGNYYEITRTTLAPTLDPFYGAWYGPSWYGTGWTWGGAWPYYGSVGEFITYYTGKVVALLDDGRGEHMRCRFELLDNTRGMAGGGTGECQTSTGARITAWFRPDEGAPVS